MRSKKKNDFLPSLKNYRAFYKVYPEVGLEVAAYLRERFGKGYRGLFAGEVWKRLHGV